MDLGHRLKAARIAAGYSQSKLAELCGWEAPSRLANYEQGIREPTLSDLRLIASKVAAGGHSFPWIVLGDDAPRPPARLTAAAILDAARIVSASLPRPRKLDPSDPNDAQMLATTITAVMEISPSSAKEGLETGSHVEGLETDSRVAEAMDATLAQKISEQELGRDPAGKPKARKVSTRTG
ncbi:helix-turn-helix transcriptional regulator [Xanthomonas translucens pv. translucens]|uniref:helix-turn-helix domain-containing protein n=1 Tax=Xanthomonas campestris pv. translucens TaxID=343 RepID=UPI003F70C5D8